MLTRIAKTITLWIIFLAILLSAYWSGIDYVAMKRESLTPDLIIQPADLYTALDMSLQVGDGRRVNWEAVGF